MTTSFSSVTQTELFVKQQRVKGEREREKRERKRQMNPERRGREGEKEKQTNRERRDQSGTTSFPQSSFVQPSVPRLDTNTNHSIEIGMSPDLHRVI